jgi:hypothetical protein
LRGSVHDICLKMSNTLHAFIQSAVRNQDFVEDIRFAKIAQGDAALPVGCRLPPSDTA